MQSAIGRQQLTRLESWLDERRRNAAVLRDALHDIGTLRIPAPPANVRHAYYRFYVFLNREKLHPDWNRTGIIDALRAVGVPCDSGICPEIYREPAYKSASGGSARACLMPGSWGKLPLHFPSTPVLVRH